MAHWLGIAAGELRRRAGRKQVHVAAAANLDQSTIWRFEHGENKGFPSNVDSIVDAYASDLDLDAAEVWALGVELWRQSRRVTPAEVAEETRRRLDEVVRDPAQEKQRSQRDLGEQGHREGRAGGAPG